MRNLVNLSSLQLNALEYPAVEVCYFPICVMFVRAQAIPQQNSQRVL